MINLFIGTDDYLRTEAAKQLIAKLVPMESRDFGLETIDSRCDKMEEVLDCLARAKEALYTESFFGSKVVWLRDINFLPGMRSAALVAQEAKTRSAAFFELLTTQALPEGNNLILTADTLPKTSRFAKWVYEATNKAIKIEDFGGEQKSYKAEQAAAERVSLFLKQASLTMTQPILQTFVRRVGTDTRTLAAEVEKLRTYLGNTGAVTLQDIEAITCQTAEAEPFELTNALLMRNSAGVVQAIHRLQSDESAAFPVVSQVLNLLNDLCCLREGLENHTFSGTQWKIAPEKVPTRLRNINPYVLKKQIAAADRYTLNELRAARHYAIEMRFKLVDSTQQDPWAILEPVLLRMCAPRSHRS